MPITIDQYIVNPMQKQGRVMSAVMREAQRKHYTEVFNQIMLRENGHIDYTMYKDEDNNVYWIHIKVPSEAIKQFYYDVVFRFFADSNVAESGQNLRKYYVQFYSNDPAYVFNYAYVFINNKLFPEDLTSRMSAQARHDAPKVTNPYQEIGYVKTLYFAFLFMQSRNLFNLVRWDEARKYSKDTLVSAVENADEKIARREEAGKRLNARNKAKRNAETAKRQSHEKLLASQGRQSTIKNTRTTNTVKTTRKINNSIKVKNSKVVK